MLVTNICETTELAEYRLGPRELVKAYRDKNRVEEGFREVKLMTMPDAQKNILDAFDCKYLGMSNYLKSIGTKMV